MAYSVIMKRLTKALAKRGETITRKNGHMLVTRMRDKRIICDMDCTGMDKAMLRSNMELLLLAVTQ